MPTPKAMNSAKVVRAAQSTAVSAPSVDANPAGATTSETMPWPWEEIREPAGGVKGPLCPACANVVDPRVPDVLAAAARTLHPLASTG